MTVLKQHYETEEDQKGELYCNITLKCDYAKGCVDISMPNYVHKKLIEYKHKTPKRPQNHPYAPPPVKYGKESNLVLPEETSPASTYEEKKCPKGTGKFSFLCTRN